MKCRTEFEFVLHTALSLGAGNSDYDNSCDDTLSLSLSLSLTSRLSASISLFVARAGARAPVFVSNLTNHYSMVCGFSVQASVFAEVCLKNVYNL